MGQAGCHSTMCLKLSNQALSIWSSFAAVGDHPARSHLKSPEMPWGGLSHEEKPWLRGWGSVLVHLLELHSASPGQAVRFSPRLAVHTHACSLRVASGHMQLISR
ncbi:unnamed protein product [Effrenium voratum]|nr:unnamed protein product [Effrenium voratum]